MKCNYKAILSVRQTSLFDISFALPYKGSSSKQTFGATVMAARGAIVGSRE